RAPPLPHPFPYTTLFRSLYKAYFEGPWLNARIDSVKTLIRPYLVNDPYKRGVNNMSTFDSNVETLKTFVTNRQASVAAQFTDNRSEEHTSELQSRENLVC